MANKTTKRTGTVQTEVIIGGAAANLNKTLISLKEVMGSIDTLDAKIEERTAKIADLELKQEEIQIDYDNKLKQSKIDLDLEIRKNRMDAATRILSEAGMEAIPSDELSQLREELKSTKLNMDKEVSKQVAIATTSLERDHTNKMSIKDLQHKEATASLSALNTQQEQQIKFLTGQISDLRAMIESERTASIEREKARQGQGSVIQVGNGK